MPISEPGAIPSGNWGVAVRDDGSRQWTYRGFALYRNTGDMTAGDMVGNDSYQIVGEYERFSDADSGVHGTTALVWRVASP